VDLKTFSKWILDKVEECTNEDTGVGAAIAAICVVANSQALPLWLPLTLPLKLLNKPIKEQKQ
jgi:hypothetical protein